MLRVWILSGIFLDYSFPDQSSYFYIAWVIYIHDKVFYLSNTDQSDLKKGQDSRVYDLSTFEEQKTPLCSNEEVHMDDT